MRIRLSSLLAGAALASTLGCNSVFTDLRPDEETGSPGPTADAGVDLREDASAVDDASGVDGATMADAGGTVGTDAGAIDSGGLGPDRVLARGSFEGRTGYNASGDVELRVEGGVLQLVFADNFESQGVPGPAVIVSERESIGNRIDPDAGDVEVAALQSEDGAQTYTVPMEGAGARYAWVYCRPFRVEVARAELTPVSP